VAEARKLTGLEMAEASIQTDAASGATRVALVRDGVIAALLFVAPRPVVVARTAVIAAIGTDTAPLAALAGRSAANLPDPGATVCACFNVGRNTLISAIANGAGTVAALGQATCAGTNCGSCKPELQSLIAGASTRMAAE
jgi:assimilatory nitrate reductase catalytic subunit